MSDPDGAAPADRFCDLVMKGGITSGVVYPPAICELAAHYRFRNIGGTSAGAIAAVVTAAAEFRRRHTSTLDGFTRLAALPTELGQTDARGNTRLLRLFQPDRPCRRLFGILIGSLNQRSTLRRVFAVFRSCILSYWPATLLAVAGSLAIGTVGSLLDAVLFLAISLPVLVASFIYRDVTRTVVHNNYGLCKGMTTSKTEDALTDWLHKLIQESAGLPLDKPLTFG